MAEEEDLEDDVEGVVGPPPRMMSLLSLSLLFLCSWLTFGGILLQQLLLLQLCTVDVVGLFFRIVVVVVEEEDDDDDDDTTAAASTTEEVVTTIIVPIHIHVHNHNIHPRFDTCDIFYSWATVSREEMCN